MYQEVSKLEELPVIGGNTAQTSDSDIDLDAEEIRQRKSSQIRLVVLVLIGAGVCAVLIAVVLSVLKSDSNSSSNNGYDVLHNMEPLINSSKFFCGPVHGTLDEDTFVFKGIPYAVAPVGELRWEPPQSLSSLRDCWVDSSGFEAHHFGPKCFQYNPDTEQPEGSEDCLYINVWTPQLGEDQKRCVMVYIHGGGLVTGSGHDNDTVMSSLITRMTDCVYVSFNYRLNAFGFLALKTTSQDAIPGNFGFLDQIQALKWVQENIAAFGGDPNKVTVFGDGSGATSIVVLVSTPLAKGLFQGAWLISAAPRVEGTLEQAHHQNSAFLKETGCEQHSHDEIMKCLREQSPESVLRAAPYKKWLNSHLRDLPNKTEISSILAIVDDKVIPKPSPIESWVNGPGNDVPLIIGSAAQEVDDNPGFPEMNDTDWAQYRNYVTKKLGSFDHDTVERVLSLYKEEESPEYQLSSMISDMRAVCPTTEMARAAAEYFTSPVYRYVTTHRPQAPAKRFGRKYAFHKIDLYAFLGNLNVIGHTVNDPNSRDEHYSHFFQRLLASFAESGMLTHNWEPFPNATAILYSGLIDIIKVKYKADVCEYWQYNGFYPAYAWTN